MTSRRAKRNKHRRDRRRAKQTCYRREGRQSMGSAAAHGAGIGSVTIIDDGHPVRVRAFNRERFLKLLNLTDDSFEKCLADEERASRKKRRNRKKP